MNQDESVALWRRGKEAWNAWAEDMLRQKAELQKSGTWNGDKLNYEWSDETRKWMEAAEIDLSGLRFMTRALADAAKKQVGQEKESSPPSEPDVKTLIIEGDGIDFDDFVFPWRGRFSGAQFHGKAHFWGAQFHGKAGFGERAQFHGGAYFQDAQFHGEAWFGGAQFHGYSTGFDSAQFHGQAGFENAQFHGYASFRDVQFREASFWNAQFHRGAGFDSAQFHGWASFRDVQFHGYSAGFDSAQFHGQAWFGGAQFHRGAGFQKVQFRGQAQFASASFASATSFRDLITGVFPLCSCLQTIGRIDRGSRWREIRCSFRRA